MAAKQSKQQQITPQRSSTSSSKFAEHKDDKKLIYRPMLLYVGYKSTTESEKDKLKQFIKSQLDNAELKKYFDVVIVSYTDFNTMVATYVNSGLDFKEIDIPEVLLYHNSEHKNWKSLGKYDWFSNITKVVIRGKERRTRSHTGDIQSPMFEDDEEKTKSGVTFMDFYQESQEFKGYGENDDMWLKIHQWFNNNRPKEFTTGRIMTINQLKFNGKQKKDLYVHIHKLANNNIEVVSSTYANMNITRPFEAPLVISSNGNHLYSEVNKGAINTNYVVSRIMEWLNPLPSHYSRLIILFNENEGIEFHSGVGSSSSSSSSNVDISFKLQKLPARVYFLVDNDSSSESLPLRKHFGIFNNLCQTILKQYDSQEKNKFLIYSRMLFGHRASRLSLEMIFLDYYLKYDLSLFGMLLYKMKRYSFYYPITFTPKFLLSLVQHQPSKSSSSSISSVSSGTPQKKPAKSAPSSILTPINKQQQEQQQSQIPVSFTPPSQQQSQISVTPTSKPSKKQVFVDTPVL